MIAMDACHTKNKKYPMLLFLATVVDGNNNIIILALWQKGLVDAVAEELPSNEHVHYTFHIRMNLKRHFGAQVSQYFHRLIYAETKDIFEDALKGLEERFPNGKEGVQYINDTLPAHSDQNVANGGAEQFVVNRLSRLSGTCFEPQEMLWPCIHVMSWCRSKGEDYLQFVDRIYFQKSLVACYSQNIPPITEQDLKVSVTCRAQESAIRRGRARMVRIPNGGGRSRRRTEYSYPVKDEPRFIPSQGPRSAPQTEAGARTSTRVAEEGAGPSTQAAKGKGTRRCGVCREVGHRRDSCPVRKQTEALRAQYFHEN
ncbi:hypothetical protein R1sor_000156 [Riccia sorocarpa]|uniref:MULE transposase domain-containing protein n=1 Tax=Riccia sorocarpa TaxID=122646 RepID=A0ABD3GWA9_9MARC